jgi:hypothetical protein
MIRLLIAVFVTSIFARNTLNGPSGYFWVPNGFIGQDGKHSGSITGDGKSWNFGTVFWKDRLEVSISNYYAQKDNDGYKAKRVGLPVIPALKLKISEEESSLLNWGTALGATLGYGPFFAATAKANWPFLQPELTSGISLGVFPNFLSTIYGFAGWKITLADSKANPLPVHILGDAMYASSSKVLGEVEEAFYSLGFEITLAHHLGFQGIWRQDPKTYLEIVEDREVFAVLPNQNKAGEFQFRFVYNFDALKGGAK